jgi:hypothetical protein
MGGVAQESSVSGASPLERLRARRMISLNRTMEVDPAKVSAVTRELRARDFDVEQHADGARAWEPTDVVWIWGTASWFPRALRSIAALPPERRPATVVWHAEPLPPPRAAGIGWPRPTIRELAKIGLRSKRASDVYTNAWVLRRLAKAGLPDVLAVTTGERQAFLAERGLESVRIPYGSEAADGHDLGLERDIDVLLLGAPHLRRRERVVAQLRKAGVAVDVRGDYRDPTLWGEERTKLVNRAKIMLSIGRFRGTFAGKRFLIAMSCGALVVSEPLFDPAPYIPGVHFVEASLEDMPAAIDHYLRHEDERRRITDAARVFATTEVTAEQSFSRLLDVVAERLV